MTKDADAAGAGAGVTALLLLYRELPITRIVGSDIARTVPLTLVAGVAHWLPGIVFGSYVSVRLPALALRLVLAAVLFLVAAQLLF